MATIKLSELETIEQIISDITDMDRQMLKDNMETPTQECGEGYRYVIAHTMLDCRQTLTDEDMKKYWLTVIKKYMNGSRKISKDLAEAYTRLYKFIME